MEGGREGGTEEGGRREVLDVEQRPSFPVLTGHTCLRPGKTLRTPRESALMWENEGGVREILPQPSVGLASCKGHHLL